MVATSSRRRNRHKALSLFPRRGLLATRKIGRATTRRTTGRISRSVGGRREEKRRVASKKFNALLQIVIDSRTPVTRRMALATCLVSMATTRHEKCEEQWMHKDGCKALYSAVTILKAGILVEQVPEIRSHLLRVIAMKPFLLALDRNDYIPSYITIQPGENMQFFLDVLEQELTKDEQSRAIFLLDLCLDRGSGGGVALADRVVQMCIRLLDQHHESRRLSDSDVRRVIFIMEQYLGYSTTPLSHILASVHVMPFLFSGLRSTRIVRPLVYRALRHYGEAKVESEDYSSVISNVFKKTTATSRSTLINRYGMEIETAMPLLHLDHLNRFAQHREFAEIIARTPQVLGKMASELCTADNTPTNNCSIVMNLLNALQGNDSAIQELLGYGLLNAACPLAQSRYYNDNAETATFQRVLNAHPEWKHRFKVMVRDGDALSQLRQLGDAIPDRVRRPAQYVLE